MPRRGRAQFYAGARRWLDQRVRSGGCACAGASGAAQESGDRAVERGLARPHGEHAEDHKLSHLTSVNTWRTVQATPRNEAMLAVLGMESGFETDDVAVISEQDILGDRLVRPRKASRKLDNFISEVTSLASGDLVVHVEHGIGRFVGLQTLEVSGAPHDCLELHYAAETKLFPAGREYRTLCRATAPTTPMSNWIGWAAAAGRRARPS